MAPRDKDTSFARVCVRHGAGGSGTSVLMNHGFGPGASRLQTRRRAMDFVAMTRADELRAVTYGAMSFGYSPAAEDPTGLPAPARLRVGRQHPIERQTRGASQT